MGKVIRNHLKNMSVTLMKAFPDRVFSLQEVRFVEDTEVSGIQNQYKKVPISVKPEVTKVGNYKIYEVLESGKYLFQTILPSVELPIEKSIHIYNSLILRICDYLGIDDINFYGLKNELRF